MFSIQLLRLPVTIPPLRAPAPTAINNRGDIVGIAWRTVGFNMLPVGVRWKYAKPRAPLPIDDSELADVNVHGVSVGRRNLAGASSRAIAVSDGGTAADIDGSATDVPGSAYAVNDLGVACGRLDGHRSAFVTDAATRRVAKLIDVPPAGGACTPTGVNTSGEVVGHVHREVRSGFRNFGFHWKDGVATDLPLEVMTGINDAGLACGANTDSLGHLGHVIDARSPATPPTPIPQVGSHQYMFPWDINASGAVVGDAERHDAVGGYHQTAFLYDGRKSFDLWIEVSAYGWNLHVATAINDAGEIVGYGKYFGVESAFLLRPVRRRETTVDVEVFGWLIGGVAAGGGGSLLLPNGDRIPVPPAGEWLRLNASERADRVRRICDTLARDARSERSAADAERDVEAWLAAAAADRSPPPTVDEAALAAALDPKRIRATLRLHGR